jgi:hypothetical protein
MRCIEGVDCCNANPGKETQIEWRGMHSVARKPRELW